MKKIDFLKKKSTQIRKMLLKMIHNAGMGHTGGSLSSTDILTTLYYEIMNIDSNNPEWKKRDRFILSKGHSIEAYYCILADKGFISKEELQTFCQYKTRLIGHPNNKVPGIEMNTGALGHGLSIASGIANAARMDGKSYKVFALMGDGEQAEGSIWEAAMTAAHYQLDNLVGIIDRNRLQITDDTEKVMALEPLEDKWEAFGWEVREIDGHNHEQLLNTFNQIPFENNKPSLIIARTVKGKGVSFMENGPEWHHGVPDEEQLKQALEELSQEAPAETGDDIHE